MKKTSLLLLALTFVFAFSAKAQTWETNYNEAVAKAKAENKALLLNFTGSDWCGWCHKLDGEVFSKEEFKNYAEQKLVLVKLDFPRRKQLPEAEKQQNRTLASKHNIKGYPTILLLDANEKLLLKTGYQYGGATKYVEHLNDALPASIKGSGNGSVVTTGELVWETDYAAAVAKAKAENKTLLLNFTGSDWCGWCHKLDREVFKMAEFKKYAAENLVLVKLDFPRRKQISEAEKQQNNLLASKHNVKGFPTILLLDKKEKLLLTTGYQNGGAAKYVEHLESAIN